MTSSTKLPARKLPGALTPPAVASLLFTFVVQAGIPETAKAQAAPADLVEAAGGEGAGGAPGEVEEITVIASRVQRQGFSAPTPTTVLNTEDLLKIGASNVGDVLNTLPTFLPTATPTASVLD